MVSTRNLLFGPLPPSPPPLPSPPPHPAGHVGVTVLHCGDLWLAPVWRNARDVREELRDVAHGLGASLSEDHPGPGTQVLWVLDEAEEAGSLVPCAKMVLVHGHNGGCLLGAATVNCAPEHIQSQCDCITCTYIHCMYNVHVRVDMCTV